MKNEIDKFNNNIKEIINKLNELSDNMNIYYEINNNIVNNYDKKNRNYKILQNIKQIKKNNEIFSSLNNINKMTNIKDTIFNMIDLYNNINKEIKKETNIEKTEKKEMLNNDDILSNNKLMK